MQQGQSFSQKRLTEVFKKHWKIGAVVTLVNALVMLLLVFFFIGVDKFFIHGAFSLIKFKELENLFFLIPLLIVFAQFLFCLYPTIIGFMVRNDAELNIGHDREDD